MTANEELMALQEEYKNCKDDKILGKMLRDDLLPHIAKVKLLLLLKKIGRNLDSEEVYNIGLDACMMVISHIKKGNYVDTSFTEKMKWTVSNQIKAINLYNYRFVPFDDTYQQGEHDENI